MERRASRRMHDIWICGSGAKEGLFGLIPSVLDDGDWVGAGPFLELAMHVRKLYESGLG